MKMKLVYCLIGLVLCCVCTRNAFSQYRYWHDTDKPDYYEKKLRPGQPYVTTPIMFYKESKVVFEAPNTFRLPIGAKIFVRFQAIPTEEEMGNLGVPFKLSDGIELKLKQDPPVDSWRRKRKPKDWKWIGEVAITPEMFKGEDQIIHVRIEYGEKSQTMRGQHVLYIKDELEKIDEKIRSELETWVDDLNTHIPIWGKVPTWQNLPKAWKQAIEGKDPYADLTGFMLRSYYNPQLKRQQPYTVYMPKALDQSKPMPLMILLHGSGGTHRNLIADYAAGQRFEEHPMIIANAGMLKYQEYRHLALNDVLWIVEDMKKKYNIDASRIYLQGISLGGRGTLETAALKPDIFAAISAHGVYGVQEEAADPFVLANKEPFVQQQIAKTDIRTYLPNLYNTPTEIIYGWKDPNTPPSLGLLFGDLLRIQGADFRARGFDTGHNLSLPEYDWASTREWLLKQKLEDRPSEIRHRVSNVRFGKNRWVEVTQLLDYSKVGQVIARYDDEKQHLVIIPTNLRQVTIDGPMTLSKLSFNPDRMGEKFFPKEIAKDEVMVIDFDEEGFFQSAQLKKMGDTKAVGQTGPIWDIWSKPVIYTWIESGDEKFDQLLEASAKGASRWDLSWGTPTLPSKAWADLTEEDKKTHNLIVFKKKDSDQVSELKMGWPTEGLIADRVTKADIRARWVLSPWSDDHKVLQVELGTKLPQPILLSYFGSWDAAFYVDWFAAVAVLNKQGRLAALPMLAAGAYTKDLKFGPHVDGEFRSRALLGEAARPSPKKEDKKKKKKKE